MKQPSDASSYTLETLTFFLERPLQSRLVAEALRAAGARFILHSEVFADDAPDEEWLEKAGQEGWVVLTADKRIRYRTLERQAHLNAQGRAFVVTSNLSGPFMAQVLVTALPRICAFCSHNKAPFIARIYKDASVKAWLAHSDTSDHR